MLPGFSFGGGGGSFDFGDSKSGDIYTGPTSIDARTTTGGGDPELLGQLFPLGAVVVAGFVTYLILKRK